MASERITQCKSLLGLGEGRKEGVSVILWAEATGEPLASQTSPWALPWEGRVFFKVLPHPMGSRTWAVLERLPHLPRPCIPLWQFRCS